MMISTMALLRTLICALPLPQGRNPALNHVAEESTDPYLGLSLPDMNTSEQGDVASTDIPLRISPLGASVTWGTGSSDGTGYRGPLREMLTEAGYTVNLVGFNRGGDMKDNENDGYPGLKVREIHGKLARVLEERKPNLFLINAGTNNCLQGEDEDQTDEDLGAILDDIWDYNKDTTIILSGLLTNRNKKVAACERRLNKKYQARVAAGVEEGFKIAYADMGMITVDDLGEDGTHPKDGGYRKFGSGWFAAILEAERKGWITLASHVEGIADDGNNSSDSM